MGPTGEDCISLCSNFRYGFVIRPSYIHENTVFDFYSSYCSECTNTSTGPPEDTLSSLSESERMTEMTPFRFSPTSFISDTLSLPDYEDESHNDSCSLGYLELHDRSASINSGGHYGAGCNEKAHRPSTGDTTIAAMSSLSSVSSITLQVR